jgi:hypothetical protein
MRFSKVVGLVFTVAGAIALTVAPARAGIIISVDSVSAVAGSTNNAFDVRLTNTGAPIAIAGFKFEVMTSDADITFTGADFSSVLPYILTGDSFDQTFAFALNLLGPGQSMDGSDVANSLSGPTIGTGSTVALGRVLFDVSPLAATGAFAVSFIDAGTSLSDGLGNSIPIDKPLQSGQITVTGTTATPEPGSALLLSIALVGLGWKKRSSFGRR